MFGAPSQNRNISVVCTSKEEIKRLIDLIIDFGESGTFKYG
jgi:hypothetical protein